MPAKSGGKRTAARTAAKRTTARGKRGTLAEYDAKRDFAVTPEPSGETGRATAATRKGRTQLRFVVQKHRASHLHYDFRLEVNGVLASWAIPKGPSMNPGDRRLAMHVEDHPYDYRTFEGIIPEGNYGAGSVIVWDEGTYELAEGDDPAAEIAAGKLKFVLHGKKLRGTFALVKMRGTKYGDDAWLLIKDRDEFADPGWKIDEHPESVKSGRTIEEIAHSSHVKKWISDRPAQSVNKNLTLHRGAKPPTDISPMLATLVDAPFDDPYWLFEVKWDGFRAIATVDADGRVSLRSRNDKDLLAKFPELERIGGAFRSLPIVVDGEIVALDEEGKSSFQRLQNRIESRQSRGRRTDPVTYVAFDLLFADGRDLRGLPLEERKRRLEALIVPDHGVMYSKHVVGTGKKLYELARKAGLEGIVGKRRDSTYQGRRSRDWVKIKIGHEQEFVIGGWTEPRGSRTGFGALLLGVYDGDKLRYVGHVGTGFDTQRLRAILERLRPLETDRSPFTNRPKSNAPAHFVRPELVAQVRFTEWTDEGSLRAPVFLGLREDKPAKEVVREVEAPAAARASA